MKNDNRTDCYNLNKSIENFASLFAQKYFSDDGYFDGELRFVGDMSDELNYNLFINDYYFSLQDIYYALWYDIPWEMIAEWYDAKLEIKSKGETMANLKNYFLLHNTTQGLSEGKRNTTTKTNL